MNARKKRIKQWIVTAIVALAIFGIGQLIEYVESLPEKQPITVYAPADMQTAFEHALKMSSLKGTHYIVMTNDPNSNICVSYGKQEDVNYQKFAFSPFIVAYSHDESCFKALKKSEVCVPSVYKDDYYEIDFLKVINEVIEEGKWANLGIEKQDKIKVFYPSEESIYWDDFYNFLLVTVNNGIYPEDVSELQNAEQVIDKFLNSQYTEGISDFGEQAKRIGGFPTTAFYVLPEKEAYRIQSNESVYVRFLYPTQTVYFNYYIKGDELGQQIIEAFDETSLSYDFYGELVKQCYRSSQVSTLTGNSYVYDDRNVYNVVQIPEVKKSSTPPTS